MDLATLLRRGYFPKEYAPTFSTERFADYVASVGLRAEKKNKPTKPATHNLARPGGGRRKLHIPNPISYLRVAQLLADNWPPLRRTADQVKSP